MFAKLMKIYRKEINHEQKETILCFFRANCPVFYCFAGVTLFL